MSFEVYVPRTSLVSVPPGKCRVTRLGVVTLASEDLAKADIGNAATVLLDASLRRIGLRKPRDNERSCRVAKANASGSRRRVGLRGALGHMGMDRKAAAGVRDVTVTKEFLLVINFGAPGVAMRKRPKKAAS